MPGKERQFWEPLPGFDQITEPIEKSRKKDAIESLSDTEIYIVQPALDFVRTDTQPETALHKLARKIASGLNRSRYESEYATAKLFVNPTGTSGNKATKLKNRLILLFENLVGNMQGNSVCQTEGRDGRRFRDTRSCASKESNRERSDYSTSRAGNRDEAVNVRPRRPTGFLEPNPDQLDSIIPWNRTISQHSTLSCDQNFHCIAENLADIVNETGDLALCRYILDNCRDSRARDIIRPRSEDEPISTHFDLVFLIAQLREVFSITAFPGNIQVHMMSKKTTTKPNASRTDVNRAFKVISSDGPVAEYPWNGASEFTVYDRRGPTVGGPSPFNASTYDKGIFLEKISRVVLKSLNEGIKNRSALQCLGIRNTAEAIFVTLKEIKKYNHEYVPSLSVDMAIILLAGKDKIRDKIKGHSVGGRPPTNDYFKEVLEVAKMTAIAEVISSFQNDSSGKPIVPTRKYDPSTIVAAPKTPPAPPAPRSTGTRGRGAHGHSGNSSTRGRAHGHASALRGPTVGHPGAGNGSTSGRAHGHTGDGSGRGRGRGRGTGHGRGRGRGHGGTRKNRNGNFNETRKRRG